MRNELDSNHSHSSPRSQLECEHMPSLESSQIDPENVIDELIRN